MAARVSGPPRARSDLDSLIAIFLRTPRYDRGFADTLLHCARDPSMPWPTRASAALMLEQQLLRVKGAAEEGRWVAAIGCDIPFAELRARMLRLARLREMDDLLHLARRECRITIGRWIWTADEVVKRIEALTRRSRGLPATGSSPHDCAFEDMARMLPPYERAIAKGLMRGLRIHWVSDATPAEINSLVENPIGSVVLVVKPPGSCVEIEIKRCGVRGPRALDVVVSPDGGPRMPRWHHLHGGSMEHLLLAEAGQSALFSRLFRHVHGEDAAMSRTLQIAAIGAMPGGEHPLDHFASSDPRALDTASNILSGRRRISPTPLRAASRFLAIAKPAQAIEAGNSSFRLDRLALYLSSGGAEAYFGRRPEVGEARRFADEILDEVLSVYEPPGVPYRRHAQYVAAAIDANRARARENFLSAMQQLGRFWGTLFAAGGHTNGESFVGRNAALRTVWEGGAWRIAFISLDHDAMQLAGRNVRRFHPRRQLENAYGDYRFIFLRHRGPLAKRGAVSLLNRIYRTDRSLRDEGAAMLRSAARAAFDKTRVALRGWESFDARYVAQLDAWHEAMRVRRRRRECAAILRAAGIDVEQSMQVLHRIRGFAFFYDPV